MSSEFEEEKKFGALFVFFTKGSTKKHTKQPKPNEIQPALLCQSGTQFNRIPIQTNKQTYFTKLHQTTPQKKLTLAIQNDKKLVSDFPMLFQSMPGGFKSNRGGKREGQGVRNTWRI